MKRLLPSAGIALLALATTACGPALNPFFTEASLYEDPSLAGHWAANSPENETIELRHVADSRYLLVSSQDGAEESYPATLFRVGGALFLDFQEKSGGKFTSAIHPHGLLRLYRKGDTVEVSQLDAEALAALVEQKRIGLASARLDSKTFLITAPSAKLEQFLAKHGLDPQLWEETQTYRRVVVEQETGSN